MEQQVTLADITDPTELKAMVYDRLQVRDQIQNEISAIQQRLNELQQQAPEPKRKADTA